MRYLTVHDVIWINTAITGSPQRYHFDRLENAVYSQYSYGDSRNVLTQAARMFQRLVQDKPFAQGNEWTALVAAITFLRLNGYTLRLEAEEAQTALDQMLQGRVDLREFVLQRAQPQENAEGSLREIVTRICQQLHLPMKAALAGVH
ncbi:MAG: type II toxin-antitoxin system death-on-curing family toxin [Armatimonadota bacterium]|nr:type II toxin-antitoxin system death-on-curing family toxin [bacterium]MDW8320882.1 type II toxin-antitoxin system death-on-curing family toxin [Armatimonadota bacterium]